MAKFPVLVQLAPLLKRQSLGRRLWVAPGIEIYQNNPSFLQATCHTAGSAKTSHNDHSALWLEPPKPSSMLRDVNEDDARAPCPRACPPRALPRQVHGAAAERGGCRDLELVEAAVLCAAPPTHRHQQRGGDVDPHDMGVWNQSICGL